MTSSTRARRPGVKRIWGQQGTQKKNKKTLVLSFVHLRQSSDAPDSEGKMWNSF